MDDRDQHSRQVPFVSYRSQADFFEVKYFGGPLDGSKIITDVFPDSESFVHRVSDRSYVYRYRRTGPTHFRADMSGFDEPKRIEPTRPNIFKRLLSRLAALIRSSPRPR
jgi:hypothetical protein